jgi:hypothetical protein
MNKDFQNPMECSEFEALLAEALDQRDAQRDVQKDAQRDAQKEDQGQAEDTASALAMDARHAFEAHGRSCATCGPLWEEAREGMLLLRSLEELEPPRNLLHNILAATTMKQARAESAEQPVSRGWLDRLRAGLRPSLAGMMHSRFATSFAMAFFSLSLTLTLAGVKISDVKKVDWHPSALSKSVVLGFTQVEAKVTSYYENLRLVYEVQARVRELKKNTTPAPGTSEPGNDNKQQNRNSAPDGSGHPQQQENYSREIDGSLIAAAAAKHEGAQI